uniref:Ig-like domain-containing protein n=1 Tax=Oncorhynchus mykiss TaxID=8022 RepID=A0A8C7RSF8_ONCMY
RRWVFQMDNDPKHTYKVVAKWLKDNKVKVPSSVFGLQGSCIMIPCSFNYPKPEKKPSKLTGIWLKDTYEVIYHPDSSSIIKDSRGRTELMGDLRQKNCSLRIDPLHRSDKGPFTFRIEIKDHDKYTYKDDTVEAHLKRTAITVKVGEVVSAFCSMSHSCPSDSPLLTWSHSGTPSVQSQQLTNVQWEVMSSLNFTPSSTDHNQSLVCTAAYRGGKTVKRLKTLNVKCNYRWHNSRGPLPTTGPTITLENVTRLTEALFCTAINTEGQGHSNPLKLNVECK